MVRGNVGKRNFRVLNLFTIDGLTGLIGNRAKAYLKLSAREGGHFSNFSPGG